MANKIKFDHCFKSLLKLLKWQGSDRTLFESLPYASKTDSIEKFCQVMLNLGFESKEMKLNLREVDSRLLPCLFLENNTQSPKILTEKNENEIFSYNPETEQTEKVASSDISGILITFKKQDESSKKIDSRHWFRTIFFKKKKLLLFVCFLTLIQTLFLLISPIYVINVYDKVIVSNSYPMLLSFFIGVVLVTIGLAAVMILRTRFLGYIGAYIQNSIGNAVFKQLLRLPPLYTENASVPTQIIRLNDFNVVRNFFSGSLFTTLLEFPFLFIYFFAVWIVGGVLVVVPLVALVVSFVIAVISWRASQRSIYESSVSKADYQDFLLESFWGMRSLQFAGLQQKWITRFRDICAKTNFYGKSLLLESQVNDVVFETLTLLAGLATLVLGTVLVMNGELQLGGLIGTMFIIWRILTPIKSINTMLPKLMQLKLSAKQINDLMKQPVELPTDRQWKSSPQYIVGAIRFDQVTFRYPNSDSPALKNVSFSLKTGQLMLVIGPSASGKSTMANLILAIYSPQVGQIYIDGHNVKQYDVNLLRKSIAYVPQKTEFFYGTIADNIGFSHPTASREQIIEAVKAADLYEAVEMLPEGLDTRIRFYSDEKLGPEFCQKINLARAYLRDAPILVLDEPMGTLDAKGVVVFENFLKKIKGKKTVIIFGHNPRLMPLADVGMILYDGYVVASGDPSTVMKDLPQGMV